MNQYHERSGLYELFMKVDDMPIANNSKRQVKELIENFSIDGGLWDNNTIGVIDRIRDVIAYCISDMDTFGYESEEPWREIEDSFRYIRMNLGKILG